MSATASRHAESRHPLPCRTRAGTAARRGRRARCLVCDAPMLEAARPRACRSPLVGILIERPELVTGLGVERLQARVHGGEVENGPDHDGGCLEGAWPRAALGEGCLAALPCPGDLQLCDPGSRDCPGRRVRRVRLVGADQRPPGHGVLPGVRGGRAGEGGGCRNDSPFGGNFSRGWDSELAVSPAGGLSARPRGVQPKGADTASGRAGPRPPRARAARRIDCRMRPRSASEALLGTVASSR